MKIDKNGKKLAFALGLCALAGGSVLLTGCEEKPLVTATIDTTKVLQVDKEYQTLAQEYFNARIKLAGELQDTVAKTGGEIKDQATYDKFAKAESELNKTWLGITRKFTDKKMAAVREVCEGIRVEKGIDLVLLDSSEQPAVEYGAIDITADVMVELSKFAGSGSSTGEAAGDSAASTPDASTDKKDASAATPAAGAATSN